MANELDINRVFPIGMSKDQFRRSITTLKNKIQKMPNCKRKKDYKTVHSFGDGLYIREFNSPAGDLIVTHIHKYDHPYFLMEGECIVVSDAGREILKAPHYGITKAGTQRVLLVTSPMKWITVHATEERRVSKLVPLLTAKSYRDLDRKKA
jgi:hypothetical protein